MKKNINIAVMVMVSGLAMTAGALELNGLKAADVTVLSEPAGLFQAAGPVPAEGGLKAAVPGNYEFYGKGYSVWQAESRGKAEADLRGYTSVLKENGISVIKAEVAETEGYLRAKVSYSGQEVLFRATGSALTLAGASSKMEREVSSLKGRGAVIIRSEAYKGKDEWGSAGGYVIEYFLAAASRGSSGQALMKEISAVLASGPLPGGCSLEVNAYRPSAFQPGTGDNLNVGIAKKGGYTDILMVGAAHLSPEAEGKRYAYESVSCPSDGWIGRCEKSSFTLVTGSAGRIISVSIERAKEKAGPLGAGWNVTGAVICR